jgi:hypothetical protein
MLTALSFNLLMYPFFPICSPAWWITIDRDWGFRIWFLLMHNPSFSYFSHPPSFCFYSSGIYCIHYVLAVSLSGYLIAVPAHCHVDVHYCCMLVPPPILLLPSI